MIVRICGHQVGTNLRCHVEQSAGNVANLVVLVGHQMTCAEITQFRFENSLLAEFRLVLVNVILDENVL